jgi:hypothetical protein
MEGKIKRPFWLASQSGLTEAFRQHVEELEPGAHQFFPVMPLDQ